MLTRFFRSLIAAFILLNALLSGAVAEGLRCSELEHEHQGHAHIDGADGAAHHGIADDPIEPESSTGTLEHEALGCHSEGAGCPGCIAPVATANTTFSEGRVAYTISDDIGRSIDSTDSLRPPISSI
jgi:hypothetical protein